MSDCEELVGGFTGDDGIGNAFPTVLPNADYSYYTLKTSGFKTFWIRLEIFEELLGKTVTKVWQIRDHPEWEYYLPRLHLSG